MKNHTRFAPLLLVSLPAFIPAVSKTINKSPNVLFFIADDLGWMDLGCYGSKFYESPNIDQLAREGMLFTNAYAACPVSSPTRAAFQTGRYPARIGITDWIPGNYYKGASKGLIDKNAPALPPENVLNLPLSEITIGEMLKTKGYKTAHIGKWHLAEDSLNFPQYQGYDLNIGGCAKGHPNGYFAPYNNPYLPDGPQGEYLTDRLGDECVKVLQQFQHQPFFISYQFYQVHLPLTGKPDKVQYFKDKAKQIGLDAIKNEINNYADFNKTLPFSLKKYKEKLVQNNPVYAAMIASMDENVGKVIAELKRLGLYDNTIIIFTSDNGGLTGPTTNLPLRAGKGFLYEGGVREPLIAKWNGHFPTGQVSNTLVSTVDYFPTILDLLGISASKNVAIDGVSIKPALEGKNQHRGPIFWHYPHYHGDGGRPAGAIRKGDFKLIEFFDTGEIELYNLKTDISERTNLAKSNTQMAHHLLKKLRKWQHSINAKTPTVNKKLISN